MKRFQNQTGRATSMARGLAIGTLTSLIITLAAAVFLAKLVDMEIIPWEKIGYGIIAAILTASFTGAWISYHKIRHQRLMVCLLAGVIYWATLFCIAALLYSGEYQGVFVTSGIILAGCISAFLMSTPRNRQAASRKHRNIHR